MRPRNKGGRLARSTIVVKIGGSLLGSAYLRAWIDLVAASKGAVVVVAGGGPFADAVRLAQRKWKCSDSSAHRMAILAMEQFAFLLCGLEPRLHAAASCSQIAAACRRGTTPVWLPARMTFAASDLPESWDVTSDSLAIWLAAALGIRRVVLVKSAKLPRNMVMPGALVSRGIVDPFVPSLLSRLDVECRAIEAERAAQFASSLQGETLAGTQLAGLP